MSARIFVMLWAFLMGSLMLGSVIDRSEERGWRIAEAFLAVVCYVLVVAAFFGWGA